jgi:hypothetical protein
VGDDDELFELDPIEEIKKDVRKENMELISLGGCDSTKENKKRCIVYMEYVQRYVVSTIF